MDKWSVVDLIERGVRRAKIIKQVQDSGYFGEDGPSVSLGKKSVQVVTLWDENYPESLKEIPDPPVCLFLTVSPGRSPFGPPSQEKPLVSVVGSRKISERGRRAIHELVPALVAEGFGIVSGLAFGTDTLVHKVCLDCGGTAVGVLPTSLDQIYPRENIDLAGKIVKTGGCLISEYPVGSEVKRKHFLERNRIMVGLSSALVVVEAGRFSGTTASANFALEQGKEVYVAVDEDGEAIGEGAKELIEDGALPLAYRT